jgi:hypothetical protein
MNSSGRMILMRFIVRRGGGGLPGEVGSKWSIYIGEGVAFGLPLERFCFLLHIFNHLFLLI